MSSQPKSWLTNLIVCGPPDQKLGRQLLCPILVPIDQKAFVTNLEVWSTNMLCR